MFEDSLTGYPIPRRTFLSGIAACWGAAALAVPTVTAGEDELYVLKAGDPGRLRLDFNANRQKVRLLALVSPT